MDTVPRLGGRWVSTYASDIEPGDTIRRNGAERHVIGRGWPPAYEPTFLLTYTDGSETVAKTAVVAIWDPDGSVTARVSSLSAATAVFGSGHSPSQGAGGLVRPER